MDIYSNIEALMLPFIGDVEVYYDGLPESPITAIAVHVMGGSVERRHGRSAVNYRVRLVSRNASPDAARAVLKSV